MFRRCINLIVLAILCWVFFPLNCLADQLSDRFNEFPNWNSKPVINHRQGELIYPEWFKGEWLVTSKLLAQYAPLAPDLVTPGFESNRQYLNQEISFLVRFVEQNTLVNKSAYPLQVKINSPAKIIADRAFNGLNIGRAYLGEKGIKSVKINPQKPTEQITELGNGQQLLSVVSGYSSLRSKRSNFISTELTQQIFQSNPQIYLNTVETTTSYEYKNFNSQSQITADQLTAIYLSPQDPNYFQAIDRPVALYRYSLHLQKID